MTEHVELERTMTVEYGEWGSAFVYQVGELPPEVPPIPLRPDFVATLDENGDVELTEDMDRILSAMAGPLDLTFIVADEDDEVSEAELYLANEADLVLWKMATCELRAS